MIGRVKVFARFTQTLALHVVHADSDKTVGVERTVRLRVRKLARLRCIETLPMLKLRAHLEENNKHGGNKQAGRHTRTESVASRCAAFRQPSKEPILLLP